VNGGNEQAVSVCVLGNVVDESIGSSVNANSYSLADGPSPASPSSSDSELAEDLLADEQSKRRDVFVNDEDSRSVKKEVVGDDDDDVDVDFYPRRNSVDGASLNSIFALDHNYFRLPAPEDYTAAVTAHNDDIVIKQEPLDFVYEDGISGMLQSEFGNSYIHPKTEDHAEVKTETADDLYSAAAHSLDSFELYSDSDDFYGSEKSDDFEAFESEHSSESESCYDNDEPVRKKIRVAFGLDPTTEESSSVIIDSQVWEDPKMHMTPVVELEDVLQIILAWQQNIGETDDIM